jgi:SAM-dependent methyltransferase
MVEYVEDVDWERVCMQDFKPMQFGERVWICPSWEEPPVPDAVNILLDPGLAFGTGTHPTTALCLEWLDAQALQNKLVIDYGCGSGILAIAAVLLGASRVIAIDNDPQAILASESNRGLNGINATQMSVHLPGVADHPQADILVANILSGPLEQLTPVIAALVKPGVKPVIWESDVKPSRRTVLNPIDNPGQQLLVDWIGTYFVLLFSVLYILFLYVVTYGREFVPPRRETQHCSADYSRRAGIRALQHPMVLPFLPTVGRGEGRQGNCSIYYYPVEELDHLRPLG